jgi:hypothetical protein
VRIGLPWTAIAILTLFQRLSPHHLQGRVFTALEVLTSAPQVLSIGVGAALITTFDYRFVLAAEGLVLLLSAGVLVGLARSPGEATEGRIRTGQGACEHYQEVET